MLVLHFFHRSGVRTQSAKLINPQKSPVVFVTESVTFAERSRAIAGPNSGLYATELRCALLETRPATFFYDSTLP